MVEPLAAALLNSVLPTFKVSAVARAMKAHTRPSLTSNFFTPLPRQCKGKAKAVDLADNPTFFVLQCQEWSCCVATHTVCSERKRILMTKEFVPLHESTRRSTAPRTSQPSRGRFRFTNNPPIYSVAHGGQRRHTSHEARQPGDVGTPGQPTDEPKKNLSNATSPQPSTSSTAHGNVSGKLIMDDEAPDTHPGDELPSEALDEELSGGRPEWVDALESRVTQFIADEGIREGHRAILIRFFNMLAYPMPLKPEAAWPVYTKMKENDLLRHLYAHEHLYFLYRLIRPLELRYMTEKRPEALKEWASNIQLALGDKEQCIESTEYNAMLQKIVSLRLLAMLGDTKSALAALRELVKAFPLYPLTPYYLVPGFEAILSATAVYQGEMHAFIFILENWEQVAYLLRRRGGARVGDLNIKICRSFRKTAASIITNIRDPASILKNRESWDKQARNRIATLFVDLFCENHRPLEALTIYRIAEEQGDIELPIQTNLTLVRELTSDSLFEDAAEIFDSLPPRHDIKYYPSTGLYLDSHQGNFEEALAWHNQMAAKWWNSGSDDAMLMFAHAVRGDIEAVALQFDRLFPMGPDERRSRSPDYLHYSILIFAHSQVGDFEGINRWLQIMTDAGIKPDAYVYNSILRSFCLRGDMPSVATVLDEMHRAGIPPNIVSYTTVITLLAHRRDPVGAEAIFTRALREGLVPDVRMISSMMNAHVEAGNWGGVIRVFDYLATGPTARLHLTLQIYNNLLKAYVLIGAPFRIVSRLFARLEASKVRPDARTYAMLVQSACDAGEMRTAIDIYNQLDQQMAVRKAGNLVNVYILTIIMIGYLKKKDRGRAKAVYDEMLDLGIKPTAATFRSIMKAYGTEGSEGSIEIAENFVKSLLETPTQERTWDVPDYGGRTAIDSIYAPLMKTYVTQGRVQDAERIFDEIIDAGEDPGLGNLTNLLDVYRRTFDIENVLRIWPQIFEHGLQRSTSSALFDDMPEDESRTKLQSTLLCVPLSIYMDALSAAGMHLKIAEVWKQFQAVGFNFDSHNWNHLAVALVRAGEPVRAFEVIEKVLLPYQRKAKNYVAERDRTPSNPLSFDEAGKNDDTLKLLSKPPMHSGNTRVLTVREATERLEYSDIIERIDENHEDFAHALFILHQIAPSWNIWRPHQAVLFVLSSVLRQLSAGYLIKPVMPAEEVDEEPSSDSEDSQEAARRTLNTIFTKCPETVQIIEYFDQMEARMQESRKTG